MVVVARTVTERLRSRHRHWHKDEHIDFHDLTLRSPLRAGARGGGTPALAVFAANLGAFGAVRTWSCRASTPRTRGGRPCLGTVGAALTAATLGISGWRQSDTSTQNAVAPAADLGFQASAG